LERANAADRISSLWTLLNERRIEEKQLDDQRQVTDNKELAVYPNVRRFDNDEIPDRTSAVASLTARAE
jgi:hypothetical protein